jgi:hypothetical protein
MVASRAKTSRARGVPASCGASRFASSRNESIVAPGLAAADGERVTSFLPVMIPSPDP